jgi:hypothetical protein
MPPKVIAFLRAYLAARNARVVVGGEKSNEFILRDQVFQGTVLGPKLWNTYFADIRFIMQQCNLIDLLFADDANAFQIFSGDVDNGHIMQQLTHCQGKCHEWGDKNQIEFENTKEKLNILSRDEPMGDGFKLLGVEIDTKLDMHVVLKRLADACNIKLKCLFRMRKYYSEKQMFIMYKSQVLATLEWCTPAIYHCTATQLDKLDRLQRRFLNFMNVSEKDAYINNNLAPLPLRRHFAMLGFIFRCVHGIAPSRCCSLFERTPHEERIHTRWHDARHAYQLVNPVAQGTTGLHMLLKRSVYGMVTYWNNIPKDTVALSTVKLFQRALNKEAKNAVTNCSIRDLCDLKWVYTPYGVEQHFE